MVHFYIHKFHGRLQAFKELSKLQLLYREKFYPYSDVTCILTTSKAAAYEIVLHLCAPTRKEQPWPPEALRMQPQPRQGSADTEAATHHS